MSGKLGPMSEYVRRAAAAAYVTDEPCHIDPTDHRRGQDAIRSFKLLADWLLSQGYERHRGESNAQFVGRVLRETIGKGGMP